MKFTIFCVLLIIAALSQIALGHLARTETAQDVPSNSTVSSKATTPATKAANITQLSASGTALATNVATALQENLSRLTNRFGEIVAWRNYSKVFNNLWTNLSQSEMASSRVTLSVASVTLLGALSMLALYLFPSLRTGNFLITDRSQLRRIGEIGRSIEEIAVTVNKAIDSYSNTEPETCVMMALCTLGNAKQATKRRSRTIDTINTVLNFPGLDEFILANRDYRESHAFGRNGGDCELINRGNKCPFNYDTWKLLLSSLSSVI